MMKTSVLKQSTLLREDALSGGRWHGAADAARFEVRDPADGQPLARVADCTAADAARAVDHAVMAFAEWKQRSAQERASLLKRWHKEIVENAEDLARLISLEQGKPIAESRAEITYGAGYIEWFAEEARRVYGDVIPAPATTRRIVVLKEPVGVVAAVTPWNFPMAMLARKLAPALAAGCTVVAKPAEDTPLSALALAYLAERAGIPAGVLNVLPASRERSAEVVASWLDDERVRKLSFTGSTAVGRLLAARSVATLKRVSLELGGNAPFIVFDDADLDAAVRGLLIAKFRNAGQTCVAANRVLVQDRVYEAFTQRLRVAVSQLLVGAALDDERNQIGPLINARALEKVERHVEDARQAGASIVQGGARHAAGALFYAPTVMTDVTMQMLMSQEETFGPVAGLMRFTDEAQAIHLANATPYGLAAYFYSRDLSRVWRVAAAIEAGMIGINEGLISTEVAPFGGVKQSGYGREGSRYGIDDYLDIKYLAMGTA